MSSLTTIAIVMAMAPVTMIGSPLSTAAKVAPITTTQRTEGIFSRKLAPTEWKIEVDDSLAVDPIDALRDEVLKFASLASGWDGPGSMAAPEQSRNAALAFIDRIPKGLPLPGAMMSQNGEIEFFWDLAHGYADITFEASGLASFFSRANNSAEEFIEALNESAFTRAWFFERLGALDAPIALAA